MTQKTRRADQKKPFTMKKGNGQGTYASASIPEQLVQKINESRGVEFTKSNSSNVQSSFQKVQIMVSKMLPFDKISGIMNRFLPKEAPKTKPVIAMYISVIVFIIAYLFVLNDFQNCKVVKAGKEVMYDVESCKTYSEYQKQPILRDTVVNSLYTTHVTYNMSTTVLRAVDSIFPQFRRVTPLFYKLLGSKLFDMSYSFFEFQVQSNDTGETKESNSFRNILKRSSVALAKELFKIDRYKPFTSFKK